MNLAAAAFSAVHAKLATPPAEMVVEGEEPPKLMWPLVLHAAAFGKETFLVRRAYVQRPRVGNGQWMCVIIAMELASLRFSLVLC
jgi:hypothetical protein